MSASTLLALSLLAGVSARTVHVSVGGTGTSLYDPASVTAAAGDIVRFIFIGGNHTVRQSNTSSPCTALADGFVSGFKPDPGSIGQSVDYTVSVTTPLYFYSEPVGRCDDGMVFTINGNDNFSPAEKVLAARHFHPFHHHSGASPSRTLPSTSMIGPLVVFTAFSAALHALYPLIRIGTARQLPRRRGPPSCPSSLEREEEGISD